MKNNITIAVLLIIGSLMLSCSAHRYTSIDSSLFRVKSIKRISSDYIIYAIRNDSNFMIVSISNKTDTNQTVKIKSSKYYQFKLKIICPTPLGDSTSIGSLDCNVFEFRNGYFLFPKSKYHNTIYLAKNLNGQYLRK